jgi:hypothetical protein
VRNQYKILSKKYELVKEQTEQYAALPPGTTLDSIIDNNSTIIKDGPGFKKWLVMRANVSIISPLIIIDDYLEHWIEQYKDYEEDPDLEKEPWETIYQSAMESSLDILYGEYLEYVEQEELNKAKKGLEALANIRVRSIEK